MEFFLLIAGVLIGGVLAWYIATMRSRQSHVSRAEHDLLSAKLNETTTALSVEKERSTSLAGQLTASEASFKQAGATILEQSGTIASQRTELEAVRQVVGTSQTELEQSKASLEERRAENDGLSKSLAIATAQLEATSNMLKSSEGMVEKLRSDLASKSDECTSLTSQSAELRAQKESAEDRLVKMKEEIETLRQQTEAEFRNIATQILEEKSERFTAINKTNLETILKPLGENIEGFKKKVEEVYEKESQQRFSLGEKVAELVALNQQISADATNLTKALEGSSKTQGDWGETILERILELSGLEKGREYVVQEFLRDEDGSILKNEDGSKMRPDVIVMYPDDRRVVIDSKVSLVAYKRFTVAESKEEQEKALLEHVASMKRHIDELSRKNYPDFTQSLDFVMMFVPIEPAFMVAMHHDLDLWSFAYQKRVLLISPTNLIAALKLVADLWKREYQNRHAIEIADTGGALYDKFVGFVDALGDIETHLGRAQKSHSSAMNLLRDGNGNLLRRVEKLKKLGAKAKKSLPSALLSAPVGEEETEEETRDAGVYGTVLAGDD